MPADIADVKGEEVTLQLRQENFLQQPGDVYAVHLVRGRRFRRSAGARRLERARRRDRRVARSRSPRRAKSTAS